MKDTNLFLAQAKALIESEPDQIASLSNITALIKDFYEDACSWAGFYLMKDGKLLLGSKSVEAKTAQMTKRHLESSWIPFAISLVLVYFLPSFATAWA